MAQQLFPQAELLALLVAAPQRIASLTEGLSSPQLHEPLASGEWSLNEILAHLRACADMWGGYIAQIITHDHPTLRVMNPRTWIEKTDYREQAFRTSLQAFTTQRNELLALLKPLPPEDWQRSATVTGAGKPLELSVWSYANRLAIHERAHVNAVERITRTLRA